MIRALKSFGIVCPPSSTTFAYPPLHSALLLSKPSTPLASHCKLLHKTISPCPLPLSWPPYLLRLLALPLVRNIHRMVNVLALPKRWNCVHVPTPSWQDDRAVACKWANIVVFGSREMQTIHCCINQLVVGRWNMYVQCIYIYIVDSMAMEPLCEILSPLRRSTNVNH